MVEVQFNFIKICNAILFNEEKGELFLK